MKEFSEKIAYVTINPNGKFLKSAQLGFQKVGIFPKYLIYISPRNRIITEFKKYRLGLLKRFIFPKLKQHFGNKNSFNEVNVDIKIEHIYKVSSLNSDEMVELLRRLGIKYLINCGAGIFRKKIIHVPNLEIINAHAGKLPEYRNMNVVEWALYNNDPVVGTIHLIDSGIDTGDILYQEKLDLSHAKGFEDARNLAFDKVIQMVGKVVKDHFEGNCVPINQQGKIGKSWYRMHSYFKEIVDKKINTLDENSNHSRS